MEADSKILTIQEINRQRQQHNITQVELYTAAKVAHRTWFESLSGASSPTVRTLQKLTAALETLIAESEARP